MKFSYKFSNLLGSIYKKGNLVFTPDGSSLISPVGNRLSVYDLKNNKGTTLPIEGNYNYTALDISPDGCMLIAINEQGDVHVISLIANVIVNRYRLKREVRVVKYSPDGKLVALCKGSKAFVYRSPDELTGNSGAFYMERVFHAAHDETIFLEWSFDSKILAVCAKDGITKLYALEKNAKFRIYSLGGHSDPLISCFFQDNVYDLITIGKTGQICFWECSLDSVDSTKIAQKKSKNASDSEEEDDIDRTQIVEQSQEDVDSLIDENESNTEMQTNFHYKKLSRHYIADELRKEHRNAVLTATAYHKKSRILTIGSSTGSFFIYELPDLCLIHSLKMSDQTISSITVNPSGDWIALGCGGLGQLVVWEWQSESYIMKQQGHASNMSCVNYSVDGQLLATGGEDGKVKLWNVLNGFCFVTFSEHSNAITDILFSPQRKFLVSASLDGTVRAYDFIRYRNFRVFTSPRVVQFSCVATDSNAEFVAAGGQDIFEIFLWSVKTGKLLEVLSGHEGPVSSLVFNPAPASTTLASVSWDKSLRVWEAIEKGSTHESVELVADGLSVAFNPNGKHVAVSTLNGQITIFDLKTMNQIANIEGRNDLGSGVLSTDLISHRKSLEGKAFTSICYSADGEYLLAGGQSKNVCIYNVMQSMIVKKFEITQNRSLDAVDNFINRRKLKDCGNIDLIEKRDETEGGDRKIPLPGVRKGDMASRSFSQEVRIYSLRFSPTGQQWAAATTEGLLVYSLDTNLVFDPWDLDLEITPDAIISALNKKDYLDSLVMALKLNEKKIIQDVIEHVPVANIEMLIASFPEKYLHQLLMVLGTNFESTNNIEYYLVWITHLLKVHGPKIKPLKDMTAILTLEKSLIQKYEKISKLCEFNKYTMKVLLDTQNKIENTELPNLSIDDDESDSIMS